MEATKETILALFMEKLGMVESELDTLITEKEKDVHERHLNAFRLYFPAHLAQLVQLAELRKTFNSMKKLPICGGCIDHFYFEVSVIQYLENVCPKTTTDAICKWIENEYAKLAPKGVLHNFAFIRSLFATIIHCSVNSTAGFRENIVELNEMAFRRWVPILHRFTTEYNVAASQTLLFVVQDYAAPLKHPKCMLSDILEVLSENDKFLSYIDRNGGNYSKEHLDSIVMNCLLFNAERFPETCA